MGLAVRLAPLLGRLVGGTDGLASSAGLQAPWQVALTGWCLQAWAAPAIAAARSGPLQAIRRSADTEQGWARRHRAAARAVLHSSSADRTPSAAAPPASIQPSPCCPPSAKAWPPCHWPRRPRRCRRRCSTCASSPPSRRPRRRLPMALSRRCAGVPSLAGRTGEAWADGVAGLLALGSKPCAGPSCPGGMRAVGERHGRQHPRTAAPTQVMPPRWACDSGCGSAAGCPCSAPSARWRPAGRPAGAHPCRPGAATPSPRHRLGPNRGWCCGAAGAKAAGRTPVSQAAPPDCAPSPVPPTRRCRHPPLCRAAGHWRGGGRAL